MRRLGRFTATDVLTITVSETPIRIFMACANLTVLAFYMISQMVAAGLLVQPLLGVGFGSSPLRSWVS